MRDEWGNFHPDKEMFQLLLDRLRAKEPKVKQIIQYENPETLQYLIDKFLNGQ